MNSKISNIDCCKPTCNTYLPSDIRNIIVSAKIQLSKYSSKTLNSLYYDFGRSKQSEFENLMLLTKGLERYYDQLINNYSPCLCDYDLQLLIDQIYNRTDLSCKTESVNVLSVDESKFNQWVISHPMCVPHESWESCLYVVCRPISFDLVKVSEVIKDCMIQYQVNPSKSFEQDCKLQFKVLSTNKNCNLTYSEYSSLINCGLTHDSVVSMIDCNIPFTTISNMINCEISTTVSDDCELEEESLVLEPEPVGCCESLDYASPVVTCTDLMYQCLEEVPGILEFVGIITDVHCDVASLVPILATGTGQCPRTIRRTYRVTDGCGNTDECVQTITVFNVDSPDCDIC